MIHGSPPPGTVRIGFAVPTYGPVTGVIVVNFTIVPGSAPAGADAPSTGTTLTRATPSAASSHLILLIFCLLSREPRQRSAGPGGPRISPSHGPGTGPGLAWSAPSWTGANEHTTPISWPICGSAASTGMWFGSLDGRKAVHRRGLRSCTRAGAGTGGARGFRHGSVHYESFDRRAHRCKSSAVQINLFGAALTALRQAKAARPA